LVERFTARWQVWGPGLASFEDESGYLGTSYCSNADTRWKGMLTLAPGSSLIDCGLAGGTAANVNGFETSGGMNATVYLYAIRGTKWAKIKLSDLTLTSDGTEGTVLAERATSIGRFRSADGTEVIVIGMPLTAYRSITTVSGTGSDTDSDGNQGHIYRIIAEGPSSSAVGTMIGLGVGASGTIENKVAQNVLSGAVTADASNWQTNTTFAGQRLTFTGFALDDGVPLVGTSAGVYYLDEKARSFRLLMPELPADDDHCKNMGVWSKAGPAVILPLNRELRALRGLQGGSIGPERFEGNLSPVQGRCSAWGATERWGYFAFKNDISGQTWVCAARPRQNGDWHQEPFSWYPLFNTGALAVEAIKSIGTAGGRTLPLIAIGYGDDVLTINEGRLPRFTEDTSYTYAESGTWFGTQMRRMASKKKRLVEARVRADGITTTETVTLNMAIDDLTAEQVGSKVASGTKYEWQRLTHPGMAGHYFQPQIALARGSTQTLTPKVLELECDFEVID
jgi:hypothetical protein